MNLLKKSVWTSGRFSESERSGLFRALALKSIWIVSYSHASTFGQTRVPGFRPLYCTVECCGLAMAARTLPSELFHDLCAL
jgi:hypothetical protein